MHLAKGLEFRAVAVMACDDEIIPLQERIETVSDDADLEDVYNTERQLLYVACTRPREHLLVTSVAPASEFLDDLRVSPDAVSPDVLVNNVGTLYTFCPLTLRAKEWIDEHVQDDAQWFGRTPDTFLR